MHEALDRLTNAGLLFVRGTPPDVQLHLQACAGAGCGLRHVAAQPAPAAARPYRRDPRRRFPEIVLAQPALLAQHCAEAGLAEKAVAYWLKAGQQALARSAMAEAVAQLRKGLEVLAGLPDGPWRQQQELDLQIALGSALVPRKAGRRRKWTRPSPERARWPSSSIEPEYLVPLIVGQWVFHIVREPSTGWRSR